MAVQIVSVLYGSTDLSLMYSCDLLDRFRTQLRICVKIIYYSTSSSPTTSSSRVNCVKHFYDELTQVNLEKLLSIEVAFQNPLSSPQVCRAISHL